MSLHLRSLPVGKYKESAAVLLDEDIIGITVGPPGIGKTQMNLQLADERKSRYCEAVLGGRDLGDFMMPYVTSNGLQMHYSNALPIEGSKWDTDQEVIFNLDEFTTAKPLMQNFMLKILDERKIGEARLAKNVRILGTGNRIIDRAHVEQMSSALANRAVFYTLEPDLDAWINYGLANNFHPIVLAWVKFDSTYLMHFNEEQFMAGDPAFCSPRSNERLSKILKAKDKRQMDDGVFASLVCGTIGNSIGTKFIGFIRLRDELPSKADILSGVKGVKVPTSPEVLHAIIFSLVQAVERKSLVYVLDYVKRMKPEWHQMFAAAFTATKPALVATSEYGKFAAELANG